MQADLTVLVNSTDSFADCWTPFFHLFTHYWPNCPYPIVLNTESKDFNFPGLDLRTSRVAEGWQDKKRIPWSDCLARCLDGIESRYVLYLQEDYFLNAPVEQDLIEEFTQVMDSARVPHVRLMELDRNAGHYPSKLHPLLWEINPKASYHLSLQAGLWEKAALRGLLMEGESAWDLERKGNLRSYSIGAPFLCQSLEEFNAKDRYPIPYRPTGIIRGQWNAAAVCDLFEHHSLKVDYSQRGFYQPSLWQRLMIPWRARARRVVTHLYAQLARSRTPTGKQ
ncbi:hypothetical protein [Thiorhodococcus fuscus]|uniref:Glycosyl transferase n=1 Tax=Thiorhodococcus fuscus TaxID=527200 RepID=A0ABW4Y510_9GAMM